MLAGVYQTTLISKAIRETFRSAFFKKVIDLGALRSASDEEERLTEFLAACKENLGSAFRTMSGVVINTDIVEHYLEKKKVVFDKLINEVVDQLNGSESVMQHCPEDFRFTHDQLRSCPAITGALAALEQK